MKPIPRARLRPLLACVLACATSPMPAGPVRADAPQSLIVRVEGPGGERVIDAVVEAHPEGGAARAPLAAPGARARIDQIGRRFVPHVSAVQRGTTVDFPNSDQIRHSIYSFSAPKVFEIKLYRGFEAPPIRFDEPGLVVLGCNIHDYMLGYVYVVETPHFGVTDEQGLTTLTGLAAGRFRIRVRHPRSEESRVLERQVDLPAPGGLTFVLDAMPPPRPASLEPTDDELQDLFGLLGGGEEGR
jgi:plastocyanin